MRPSSAIAGEPSRHRRPGARGFTLIELMMVIGILVIIMGVAVPTVITTVKKGPMRQAASDLDEGFLKARMLAILSGRPAELVISSADHTIAVRSVSEMPADPASTDPSAAATTGENPDADFTMADEALAPAAKPEALPTFSANLHKSVAFRQLTINLRDMMDEPEAAVRFQPNGTCDPLAALLHSESGEQRAIELEITTGRPRWEVLR